MRLILIKLAFTVVAAVTLVAVTGTGQVSASAAPTSTVCLKGCDHTTINAAPDGATIVIASGTFGGFSVPGTNSSPKSVRLRGAGAAETTIDGDSPVVSIGAGVSVAISGVKITGGISDSESTAGGIYNTGRLTLKDSTISQNRATYGTGGIYNSGTVTLKGSTVSQNNAPYGTGGIYNSGTLTLKDSTVSGSSGRSGGAIYSTGMVTLEDSTISDNVARDTSGGIYNSGTMKLKDSTIKDNSAGYQADGGGVNNAGTATLNDSTVTGNFASGGGGGILEQRDSYDARQHRQRQQRCLRRGRHCQQRHRDAA